MLKIFLLFNVCFKAEQGLVTSAQTQLPKQPAEQQKKEKTRESNENQTAATAADDAF